MSSIVKIDGVFNNLHCFLTSNLFKTSGYVKKKTLSEGVGVVKDKLLPPNL